MIKKIAFLLIALILLNTTVSALTPTMEWACGQCGAETSAYFSEITGLKPECLSNDMSNLPGTDTCLHLIASDAKWNVNWTSWTSGNNGGGFAYNRNNGGDPVSFTHSDYGDEEDCVETSVCITRGEKGGVYNSVMPEASLGIDPESGPGPLEVTFTGECSDNGLISPIDSCTIDFGDGNVGIDFTSGMKHTYYEKGTFDANLLALNTDNQSGEMVLQITVENNSPTAVLDVNPSSGILPLTVTFTGFCSDADGNADLTSCKINFGDGNSGLDFSNGMIHVYDSAGVFATTLTATDSEAATGTDSESVTTSTPAAPSILNKLPGTDVNILRPTVSFDVNENGSGVNISSLVLFVDGNSITPTTTAFGSDYFVTWTFTYDLGDGKTIYVGASVEDNSSNSTGDVNWSFAGDTTAPALDSVSVTGYTNDSTPTITLDNPTGSPTHMALSCNGTDWKAWQAYATTVTDFSIISSSYGCLNGEQGSETIYLKLKDAAGNISTTKNDSTIYDTQNPDTPTLDSATPANEEVDLSWTAVSDNGASGLDEYVIYQNSSQIAVTTSTSYTVENLANGTEYGFKIKARDNAGNLSAFSNIINATPTSNPAADDDSSAPFIYWEMPGSGTTVSGEVLFKVHAYDDESDIRFVSFRVDDTGVGTDNSAINERFTFDWNSETVADGTHTIRAIAKSWSSDEENNSKFVEITITTNNGITTIGDPLSDEKKEEAEIAIEEAETAKETADALLEEAESVGFVLEESIRKKYEEGVSLLEKAMKEFEDEEYDDTKTKASGANAKFEDFVDEVTIGGHKEKKGYLFNEEHLGVLLDELGIGKEMKEEVQMLLEDFEVGRDLSIKKMEDANGAHYKAVITLTVTNDSNSEKVVRVVEVVSKDFALDANMLAGQGFTIIVADPIIAWDVNLGVGETAEFVYSLKESITLEEADAMLASDTINKFSVPPILFNAETELDEETFSGPVAIGLLGLGGIVEITVILIVLAIILAAAIFTVQKVKKKDTPSSGLHATTREESFLNRVLEKFKSAGSKKEEPKKPRWGYRG